jgi:hypothetical protein
MQYRSRHSIRALAARFGTSSYPQFLWTSLWINGAPPHPVLQSMQREEFEQCGNLPASSR